MMAATPRHVIFGTGAIGLATFEALRRRGERVRLVNRSGTAPVPDDIEILAGDASDPAFATSAVHGAQVVYQTLNPPYHQWVELWPALQASVLAAAQAAGARLVSMENVYMYGRPNGQPLTETRPYAAHTKKGKLRARMARELLAAHAAGNVQVAIGRASDYFGPRGGAQSKGQAAGHPSAAAASSRGHQPHRPGTGRAAVRVPGTLRRRQHQDRRQARCPRHPAGPGPGRHPGQLPHPKPSSIGRRGGSGGPAEPLEGGPGCG
jgi:nucleoside-diphosphate-sugar epimerase